MRCIAKDPAARFTTMDEVLQALKSVHGVSMTGQLAAVNMSGAYGTVPPPAVSVTPSGNRSIPPTPQPSFAPAITPAIASGQHTPMGMLRPGASNDVLGTGEIEAPPRSRAWIAVGVLLAAGIGGGLGMIAFRMTAPTPPATATAAPTTAATAPDTAQPKPATSAAPAPTTAATANAPVTFHVTTEPAGASVRDESAEVCASTPCDVTFKGDAADPSRTHKLTIAKAGYRFEARTVKVGDGPVHVKLTRFTAGGAARPQGGSPAAKPTGDNATVQPGFKDIPY